MGLLYSCLPGFCHTASSDLIIIKGFFFVQKFDFAFSTHPCASNEYYKNAIFSIMVKLGNQRLLEFYYVFVKFLKRKKKFVCFLLTVNLEHLLVQQHVFWNRLSSLVAWMAVLFIKCPWAGQCKHRQATGCSFPNWFSQPHGLNHSFLSFSIIVRILFIFIARIRDRVETGKEGSRCTLTLFKWDNLSVSHSK